MQRAIFTFLLKFLISRLCIATNLLLQTFCLWRSGSTVLSSQVTTTPTFTLSSNPYAPLIILSMIDCCWNIYCEDKIIVCCFGVLVFLCRQTYSMFSLEMHKILELKTKLLTKEHA